MNRISRSNIRIINNTVFLYSRVVILISINLYTSRIILKALGWPGGLWNI